MSKETFYFSHDYNSRNDPKIKKLLAKHGYAGYGLFWAIIEDLYNNANALPTDCETIAFDLRADKKLIESILKDFDLFVFDGDFFGSMSVQKRLDERSKKSAKARESARKRWGVDANALPTHSEGNAIKESKLKESKLNTEAEFFKSEAWIEQTAMFLKLSKPTLNKRMKEFIDEQKLTSDFTSRSIEDIRRHFINKAKKEGWKEPKKINLL